MTSEAKTNKAAERETLDGLLGVRRRRGRERRSSGLRGRRGEGGRVV
jgi:hypothetical protein